MPDVFISHSSKDAELANRLCSILEENGLQCWMAPRNIMPGDDWAAAITKAIKSSKAFIIIYSENSVSSSQVPKEIMLAGSSGSYIIPYRIDNTPLKENYEYHLGASHWIQADVSKGVFKGEELVEAVNKGIGNATVNVHISVENTAPINIVTPKKPSKLTLGLLIAGVVLLLALVIILIVMAVSGDDDDSSDDSSQPTNGVVDSSSQTDSQGGMSTDSSSSDDSGLQGNIEKYHAPTDVFPYDSNNVTVYKDKHDRFKVQGNSYEQGFVMYRLGSFMTINVSEFDSVSFSIARTDDSGSTENKLNVLLDGEKYDYFEVHADTITSDITIDLSDIDVMRLYVDGDGTMCDVAVFDMEFTKFAKGEGSDTETPDTPVADGSIVVPVEYQDYDNFGVTRYNDPHNSFSVLGVSYDNGYVFENMGGWLLFNTAGMTDFTFSVGRLDESSDQENKIYVEIDGAEYDYYNVYADAVNKDIHITLDGQEHIMKIYTEGDGVSSQVAMFGARAVFGDAPQTPEIPQNVVLSPETAEPYKTCDRIEIVNEKQMQFSVGGHGASKGYIMGPIECGMLFNVYGYNKLTMTVGRNDGSELKQGKLYFYADGYEVECITIEPDVPPKQVEIDLHGDTKTLYIYKEGDILSPQIGIYDMYFEGTKLPMGAFDIPETAIVLPTDYLPTQTGRIEGYNGFGESFTVAGEQFEEGFVISNYEQSSIAIDNVGRTELHFDMGCVHDRNDAELRERRITIYLDGVAVQNYLITTAAGIQSIDVDITDVSKIEITTDSGDVNSASIALFNMYLN